MPPDPMSDPRRTLRTLLDATLADTSTACAYALSGLSFGRAVEITLQKGAATFVVWLTPAADATAYRRTARFNIGHRGDPPDRLGYTFLDAMCARIEAWEQSLSDDAGAKLFAAGTAPSAAAPTAERVPFVEWLAVRTGLKPSSRHVASSAFVDRLVEEARSSGLRVVAHVADAFVSGFCEGNAGTNTIVYAARTEAALDAVVQAERAMIETCNRGERATAAQVSALGTALGYPRCCIDAFIPIRDLSNAEIRFHAVRRTPGRASWLLNEAIDGRVLVSYALCRCDCAASMRYGRALLEQLARVDPNGAGELERALGGLMVVFARGGALRLVVAAAPAGDTYRYATVEGAGDGPLFERWRNALRRADGIEVRDASVRVLHGAEEIERLAAPPHEVQIRWFT
jgi:hypothetical protein